MVREYMNEERVDRFVEEMQQTMMNLDQNSIDVFKQLVHDLDKQISG
jgi:hypothetical protein